MPHEMGKPSVATIDPDVVRQLVSDLASQLTHQLVRDSADASAQDRNLRHLAALMAIQVAANDLSNTAASDAAANGARYPAIGEAAGMTRQAARVRWPGLADLARRAQARAPEPSSNITTATSGEESRS